MKNTKLSWVKVGVSLASLAIAVQAQASAAEVDGDEIVVTANKREQNVQDVGIAVSALGSDSLESISKQDITAVTRVLPAVQIQNIGLTGNAVFNIRGISQADYSPHQESPIAFYSDGAYMANMALGATQFYDLERLEVLRGPQGTLFGRNATGGLVQIYTKKPTKDLDGFVTLTGGNFGTFIGEAAVGGPLSDHIRTRLSVQTKQGGAYIKNLTGRDLGADHFYAGRLQVGLDVGSTGELVLKAETSRDENGTGAGSVIYERARPLEQGGLGTFVERNYNFTVSYPDITRFDRRVTNLTANYTQDLGSIQLTSITNYNYLYKYSIAPTPSTLPNVSASYEQTHRQFSQELRLSDNDGPFRWTLGGYFLDFKSKNRNIIDVTGLTILPPASPNIVPDIANVASTIKTQSFALFGQAEFDLSDQFTVIGGLRYGWDHLKADILNIGDGTTVFTFNPTTFPKLAVQNHGNWSGKIELDYKPSDDLLVYASVNRGTKAGGFNVLAYMQGNSEAQVAASTYFKDEVLTNYEGGFKLTFMDRRAHFNVTAFHYDYKDYQAFAPAGFNFALANQQARTNGAEVNFDIRPTEGLTLSAFGAYLDAIAHNIAGPDGVVRDRHMTQAPKWTLGGSAKYDIAVGDDTLSLNGNVKWNSSQYFFLYNQSSMQDPAYAVVDARVSYAFGNMPIEVSAFVNNLTNRHYRVFTSDSAFLGFFSPSGEGDVESVFAKPRYYGASVTFRFGGK